jgi:hypothetical protein
LGGLPKRHAQAAFRALHIRRDSTVLCIISPAVPDQLVDQVDVVDVFLVNA